LFADATGREASDGQLLARFLARRDEGAEAAFRTLVVRHGPMVMGVCRRYLDDPNDADDAFQATFLVLAQRAGSVQIEESLGPWLYGVSRKVAARARRVARRRWGREGPLAEHLVAADGNDHERRDLHRVLHEELGQIPERLRAAVMLCDLEGLSHEEAAGRLHCPAGTVKSRLSRARAGLRARLARRGLDPGAAMAVSPALIDATARAAARLSVGAVPTTVGLLAKGVIRSMALSQVKLGVAILLAASGLAWVSSSIQGQGERPAKEPRPEASSAPAPAPRPEPQANPAPAPLPRQLLNTTARIRIKRNGENKYLATGSGTVIACDHGDALIVSCAWTYKPILPADKFDGYIVVDFPDANDLPTKSDSHWRTDARLVDCDLESDVALLRLHAPRDLPVAPIVPRDWKPVAGAQMVTAGCNRGGAATLWSTTVLRFLIATSSSQGGPAHGSRDRIVCVRAGEPGRTGGGLFTTDGQLAGVYSDPDVATDTGLYAPPDAIYAILERNKLVGQTFLRGGSPLRPEANAADFTARVEVPFVDEYTRSLSDARDAYMVGDVNAYKSIISSVSTRLGERIDEQRTELRRLETERAALRGTPQEIFARVFGTADLPAASSALATSPAATADRTPPPTGEHAAPSADESQRAAKIRDLERDLDRLRRELERLKSSPRP
jgi:RNA polymerase sigma factor (sigma-70 family)